MKTSKLFTVGKEFSYIGSDFQKWFGDMDIHLETKTAKLESKKLSRSMNDAEILAELKPQKVTLGEVYKTLETMDHDTWAIFYVKDKDSVLRAVGVGWDGDGWNVYARDVSNPSEWSDGYRVFSRNWNSETLNPDPFTPCLSDTLQKAIDEVKAAGYVIYKPI